MEKGIPVDAAVICSKAEPTGNGRKKKPASYEVSFDLSETYEENIKCPLCGEDITFRVKTKGDITDETRKIASELKKTARDSIVMMAASALALIVIFLLGLFLLGDIFEIIRNIVIFIAGFFFLSGLLYFAGYAKYLGSKEKAVKNYERKHPYIAVITGKEHSFKSSNSRRSKETETKFITWDDFILRQ